MTSLEEKTPGLGRRIFALTAAVLFAAHGLAIFQTVKATTPAVRLQRFAPAWPPTPVPQPVEFPL